jgi:hypothetical protein
MGFRAIWLEVEERAVPERNFNSQKLWRQALAGLDFAANQAQPARGPNVRRLGGTCASGGASWPIWSPYFFISPDGKLISPPVHAGGHSSLIGR